jgi:hypothetical protein
MRDRSLPYLAVGFGLFWTVIAAYVVRLWIAHRRVAERIDELERRNARETS